MFHDHFACIRPRSALKALSVLVLSCGLSACDPPWSTELAKKAEASIASDEEAQALPQKQFVQPASPSIAQYRSSERGGAA